MSWTGLAFFINCDYLFGSGLSESNPDCQPGRVAGVYWVAGTVDTGGNSKAAIGAKPCLSPGRGPWRSCPPSPRKQREVPTPGRRGRAATHSRRAGGSPLGGVRGGEGHPHEHGHLVVRHRAGWLVSGRGGGSDAVGEALRAGLGRQKLDRDRHGHDHRREAFRLGRELRRRRRRRRQWRLRLRRRRRGLLSFLLHRQ